MEDLMWLFDARFFYQFLFWGVLEFAYAYFIHSKLKKSLGNTFKTLPFINKTLKYINLSMLVFLSFFFIAGIINIIYFKSSYLILVGPVLMYFAFNLLQKKSASFNYNNKGLVIPGLWESFWGFDALKWEDIENVKWDRDIGQKVYGFYIYSKTFKPLRLWIERKNMDEMKGLFDRFQVTSDQKY